MIRLENVTKYYPTPSGRKYVLRNVSMEFPTGSNIAILGTNGIGKSTLLRLIGGIDYPNSGRIVSTGSISWPMGLGGGFQGSMTGRDNAKFVCRVYGSSEAQVREKIEFIHAFSEIGGHFDMPVKTYSSGMRARLSFAVSMAFDFDYYLIDELTAVGDKNFKEKSKVALKDKLGKASFITVSHDIPMIREQCDYGIYLEHGCIHIYHDIENAIASYQKGRAV